VRNNVRAHKQPGYAIVEVSLKAPGETPGDASADQLEVVADLAERYGQDDLRVTHVQNLVLPHVKQDDLPTVFAAWKRRVWPRRTSTWSATSSPARAWTTARWPTPAPSRSPRTSPSQFADPDRAENVGELKIKISGCINACGHHHVGHIGILGVDKKGEEFYQLSLGGSGAEDASMGKILGPALPYDKVATRSTPGRRLSERPAGTVSASSTPSPRRPRALQGGGLCRR
jgi:sulfite reductase (NADPH) hemoprotein beta-component